MNLLMTEAVKKLDNTIKAILPLHSCNVLFATREEAESAAEKLKMKIGENSLRIVDLYSPPSKPAYYDSVHQDKVVLRDVPKEATPEDFASLFPDALAVVIYKNTFPASNFCHAYIGFENAKRVAEILTPAIYTIAGRKIISVPCYSI
uniref:RRM domain-containing protein n=1 Tax=Daphnia galeata TaxID=27404 RepID=A0A8J2RBV5_9CRUS|nr:unnamed protein product [Daphnia galeata]